MLRSVRKSVTSFVTSAVLAVLLCGQMRAQSLARPGWAGSGMTVEQWWKHAVIVGVDVPVGATEAAAALQNATERLDQLRATGVDALLLRASGDDASGKQSAGLDARSSEGADELIAAASRRGMRVLVELPGDTGAAQLASTARMWLNHGVAGLEVRGGNAEALQTVRSTLLQVHGERVLVRGDARSPGETLISGASGMGGTQPDTYRKTHVGGAPSNAKAAAGVGRAELREVSVEGFTAERDTAARLHRSLEAAGVSGRGGGTVLLRAEAPGDAAPGSGGGLAVERGTGLDQRWARITAAIALLSEPGAALLDARSLTAASRGAAGLPNTTVADEHSVAAQVTQMSGLHHGRAAFVSGTTTLLDHDAESAVVWLRRGPGAAVMVVVCNVSAQPVRLSLAGDLARLGLRGTFLKTLSRSDNGLGGMPLEAVAVPAFGVYVGELAR